MRPTLSCLAYSEGILFVKKYPAKPPNAANGKTIGQAALAAAAPSPPPIMPIAAFASALMICCASYHVAVPGPTVPAKRNCPAGIPVVISDPTGIDPDVTSEARETN